MDPFEIPQMSTTRSAGLRCHTPAPWLVDDDDEVFTKHTVGGDEVRLPVCWLRNPRLYVSEDSEREQVANGHLIAAAPELLQALTNLAESVECEPLNHDNLAQALKAAYRAINKATA